jgi:DNA recombination protein RmuC
MSALWLLIGLLLGAAAVLLVVRGRAAAERKAQTVDALVQPIHDQLRRVDEQLAALDRDRAHQRGALDQQIRQLVEAQERLRGETGALVSALRQPQARGRWGELQLRRVVELAGMLDHVDFAEQATVNADDRVLRPDMVIHLPGGRNVVVDAKAPLHAFLNAYEARDETTRTRELAQHARLLRDHVRKLSAKGYADQFETAPDFVFLFLPGEHFHSAALEADPSLLEDGVRDGVLIATPTTLIALLRAVAYGWQQEQLAESAREVATLGRDLHHRLSTFGAHLDKVGARLRGAVGAYNDAVGSFDSRVLPSARALARHGVVAPDRELPDVPPVDLAARELHAPELRDLAVRDTREPGHAALPGHAVRDAREPGPHEGASDPLGAEAFPDRDLFGEVRGG